MLLTLSDGDECDIPCTDWEPLGKPCGECHLARDVEGGKKDSETCKKQASKRGQSTS